MWEKKKPERPERPKRNRDLAQYGIFDVSAVMNMNMGEEEINDGDDDDLEAELAALAGGAPKTKPRKKPQPIPQVNLDAIVAESLKDIHSDEELSGDDDDPALLNELQEIANEEDDEMEPQAESQSKSAEQSPDTLSLLESRLKLYEEAEKNAKTSGESSRARRFNRGIKTIKDLIKQAKAGHPISPDDIPPEVSTGVKKPQSPQSSEDVAITEPAEPPASAESIVTQPKGSVAEIEPTPEPEVVNEPSSPEKLPTPQVDQRLINMLTDRRNQYKVAALKCKKAGDNATALNYIKVAKQFDLVINAAQDGQPVDISRMPEPPPDPSQNIEEDKVQNDPQPSTHETVEAPEPEPEPSLIMATSVEEALQQRLGIYQKQEEAAKEQGNSSKARRMGRIVKQYKDAIKLHKMGKPIPVDELPIPPGYGPIPVENQEPPKTEESLRPAPAPPKKPSPISPPSTSQTTRLSGNHVPTTRSEKQLAFLLAKQKEFKLAALQAKKKGEMEQAKEYLRIAKGFEPLIEAATGGMPVDLATIPISPKAKSQLDEEYEVVMNDECNNDDTGDLDVISRLEAQLTKQLKMCLTTRDHHKALGDVAGANRFERLALDVTKDLDFVRIARRTPGAKVPKFHYESKDFSIVKSFTELNDNDLELTILRGICYTCQNPKEIDTYVKFEFPYPQEEPVTNRTSTVKDTNSPEYNQTFILPIQRTQRACQRVFKRHSIKFEVYSRGGFFRGDTLLGTVSVKLQPLETQCEIHDSFDLVEGRKKVGGKLEVRLRLRHPIVSQQVEQLHEKWLIIDS